MQRKVNKIKVNDRVRNNLVKSMGNRLFPTKLLGYKRWVMMSHIMGTYSCEADAEVFLDRMEDKYSQKMTKNKDLFYELIM